MIWVQHSSQGDNIAHTISAHFYGKWVSTQSVQRVAPHTHGFRRSCQWKSSIQSLASPTQPSDSLQGWRLWERNWGDNEHNMSHCQHKKPPVSVAWEVGPCVAGLVNLQYSFGGLGNSWRQAFLSIHATSWFTSTVPIRPDCPSKAWCARHTHTHTHADQQHEARYVSASHQATRMSVTWTVYTLKNLRRSYTYWAKRFNNLYVWW